MKISLVQAYYSNIWEALGLGYIASYCKGHEYNFFQAYFDSDETIIDGCKDSDIVGISCTSPSYKHALSLAKRLKEINPNIKTVFGGFHVTALPETNEYVDYVVQGEGEYAFKKIIEGADYGRSYLPFKDLPWPDRDLIKNERTIDLCKEMTGKRMASFQAHRGCPFNCVYCAEKSMSSKKIRTRDIEDTLDEIEFVTDKYKLDQFKFVDPTFDINERYVIDFCEAKIERGIKTEWECMYHAHFANEKVFKYLEAANCVQINVGCESGSQRMLDSMKKGIRVENIIKTFELARKHNIERRAFFIIGMPDEDKPDILMTKALINTIDPDYYAATLLCPYPGSELYDDKYKDIDWSKTDEYSNDFWKTEKFSNTELRNWQNYLMDSSNSIHKDRI